MSSEYEELKDELGRFSHKLESVAEESGKLLNTVGSLLEVLRDNLRNRIDDAIESTRKTGKEVNTFVKENPWRVAAMTVAFGFVAGWLAKGSEAPSNSKESPLSKGAF